MTDTFIHAFLPDSKKPYYLKAVHQPELDIHDIASKAEVYNIATSPKVIEEGMNAGMELIHYLVADGFRIKTPLFNLKLRVPGEYDGSESHLPDGVYPAARLQVAAGFRNYLREHISIEFDGIDQSDGMIAQATDEASGHVDDIATIGNILTIHGWGLKIEGEGANKDLAGVYFLPSPGMPVKAKVVAVNEPKTLKLVIPAELVEGKAYHLAVDTWSSSKHTGAPLQHARHLVSDFTVTAVK